MNNYDFVITAFLLKLISEVNMTGIVLESVARAIPMDNVALDGSPMLTVQSDLRVHCLRECTKYNCSSFNFGNNQCELMSTYVCEDIRTLGTRSGYKHYDVEQGHYLQDADSYRHLGDFINLGRCSPKCYGSSTTSTTTTTTTTTAPPPTTTTTTLAPTTTLMSGGVESDCSVDNDCSAPFTDCRNGVICECIAGYSYDPGSGNCVTAGSSSRNDPGSGSCVTVCPGAFGDTFYKTEHYFIFGLNVFVYVLVDLAACRQHCLDDPACASFEFETDIGDCSLSAVTKTGNEGLWMYDTFLAYEYYQRNCA